MACLVNLQRRPGFSVLPSATAGADPVKAHSKIIIASVSSKRAGEPDVIQIKAGRAFFPIR